MSAFDDLVGLNFNTRNRDVLKFKGNTYNRGIFLKLIPPSKYLVRLFLNDVISADLCLEFPNEIDAHNWEFYYTTEQKAALK